MLVNLYIVTFSKQRTGSTRDEWKEEKKVGKKQPKTTNYHGVIDPGLVQTNPRVYYNVYSEASINVAPRTAAFPTAALSCCEAPTVGTGGRACWWL